MFAVIYRSYIKPEHEKIYKNHWKTVATYFVRHRGAISSTLHKSREGLWVAYSKWPDQTTRDKSWPQCASQIDPSFPKEVIDAIAWIKHSQEGSEKFPEICMELHEEIFYS